MRLRRLLTRAALAGSLTVGTTGMAPAVRPGTTCEPNGSVTVGRYRLDNDIYAETGTGWQCVWDSWNSGATIGWGASWSWGGPPTSAKSVAASVLGWHWGWTSTGTGLPVRLSDERSVQTGWRFQPPRSGVFAVGYDLFLHDTATPDANSPPTGEVMIWLYRSGGARPPGTKVDTVKVGRTTWDLYRGTAGWPVHTFVRRVNASSATLDLADFLAHLRAAEGLSPDNYLTGVEADIEVFQGSGQLNTNSYATKIA
ncbi:MAG: celB [Streptosporangiaceae bacterium]|jgi:hypothetical protein|nr:celB [Streptosporangiaceae bacterium]